jgi:hypothetical protein
MLLEPLSFLPRRLLLVLEVLQLLRQSFKVKTDIHSQTNFQKWSSSFIEHVISVWQSIHDVLVLDSHAWVRQSCSMVEE